MLSIAEAQAAIFSQIPLPPAELLAPEAAHQRILRQAVLAPEPIPPFDRSAMDGYAIPSGDAGGSFRIVGVIHAGETPTLELQEGECVRIFTGAPIPKGASRVVLQEHVETDGHWMRIREQEERPWIRYRGEDAQAGTVLLSAGEVLGAGALSLLASIGIRQVAVSPKVRVVHWATGNELVAPEATPGPGQIRDSNSPLIAGLLRESGATLVHQERVPDSLDAMIEAARRLPENAWDLLLVSGGASVGDFDFGARALEALGFQIHFRQLRIKPGKPLIFATRGAQAAFVIPGNPLSHFVTFHLAIAEAIRRFSGIPEARPLLKTHLGAALSVQPDRRETWWPAKVLMVDGALQAFPLPWQSSGDIRGLAGAQGLLRVPPSCTGWEAGTEVECLLLELSATSPQVQR